MKIFYSKAKNSFYDDTIHTPEQIPADAREIPVETHRKLIDAQGRGKVIIGNASGLPIAVDPPKPTKEELSASARAQRDGLLKETDWTMLPDVPEALKSKYVAYRQALRDITKQPEFPEVIVWPEPVK